MTAVGVIQGAKDRPFIQPFVSHIIQITHWFFVPLSCRLYFSQPSLLSCLFHARLTEVEAEAVTDTVTRCTTCETHTHKNSHIQGIQMKTNLPKLISIKWHRNAFHKIQHRILNTIPKLLDKSTQNPFCLLTGRGRSLFHRLRNPASLHRTNIWDLMQHYILMLVLHLFFLFFFLSSLKKTTLLTLTSSLSRGYKKLQKKVFVQQQHKNI